MQKNQKHKQISTQRITEYCSLKLLNSTFNMQPDIGNKDRN